MRTIQTTGGPTMFWSQKNPHPKSECRSKIPMEQITSLYPKIWRNMKGNNVMPIKDMMNLVY